MSFLIVEHYLLVNMNIVNKLVVLDCGPKIAENTSAPVRADEAVIATYRGTSHGVAVAD